MAKVLSALVIILLLGAFTFSLWDYYNQLPGEAKQFFVKNNEELNVNATNHLSMFMDNMRFDTSSISYSFVDCDKDAQDRMKKAFQIVSDETKEIIFYESQSAKIIIYCSEKKGEERNSTFVAGEGGPDNLVNLSLYPLIGSGKIYLYGQTDKPYCDYPIVELHELMHVFGFDHINKTNEILYPYVKCDQRMTSDIVDELKRLDSIKPKADLTLQNLSVNLRGNYLDFNITILNRGLISARNISLEIAGTERVIETVPIGELSPGISQTITARNILLKTNNRNQISFKVSTTTEEYFTENNQLMATSN